MNCYSKYYKKSSLKTHKNYNNSSYQLAYL